MQSFKKLEKLTKNYIFKYAKTNDKDDLYQEAFLLYHECKAKNARGCLRNFVNYYKTKLFFLILNYDKKERKEKDTNKKFAEFEKAKYLFKNKREKSLQLSSELKIFWDETVMLNLTIYEMTLIECIYGINRPSMTIKQFCSYSNESYDYVKKKLQRTRQKLKNLYN